MATEWPIVKIDEIQKEAKGAIAIGPFGSRMKSDCYTPSGIPVIRGTNITGGPSFEGDFVYISAELADSLGSCNVYLGDLVFPHRGSIGEVGIVSENDRYVISSSLMKLTCNQELANPWYVYYFFKSNVGKHELLKNASQVGTPGIGQPLTSLKSIDIPLPPLKDQKYIVHLLKTLDDKIELNRQINATLESMAQALFKSWFVDFDPVIDNALAVGNPIPEPMQARADKRAALLAAASAADTRSASATDNAHPTQTAPHTQPGATAPAPPLQPLPADLRALFPDSFVFNEEMGWVPEGWGMGVVEDLLVLQRGFDLPKNSREEGLYPLMAASGQDGTHNECKVRGPGVTTGRSGKLGEVSFVENDYWPLNTVLWVKEFKRSSPYHAFYFLKSMDLEKYNSGSAVPTLNRNYVHNVAALIPSAKVVAAYDKIISSFYTKKNANNRGNEVLARLRDELLPRLLSGQVRLSEVGQGFSGASQ